MMPISPRADYGTLTLAAASDDLNRLAKRDNEADPVVRQGAFDVAVSLGAAFGFSVVEVAPYLDDVATPSAYKVHYAIGGNAFDGAP